jgi:hypothetical protein
VKYAIFKKLRVFCWSVNVIVVSYRNAFAAAVSRAGSDAHHRRRFFKYPLPTKRALVTTAEKVPKQFMTLIKTEV